MKKPPLKIGDKFGRLTTLEKLHIKNKSRPSWRCKCECGNEVITRSDNLTKGDTNSCGCIAMEIITNVNKTHGQAQTPEYLIWKEMIARCNNPQHQAYKYYGSRGISVFPAWREDFTEFINHIGKRPDPSLSIDRINNDGNYEPGNVRWATIMQQANNKRKGGRKKKVQINFDAPECRLGFMPKTSTSN